MLTPTLSYASTKLAYRTFFILVVINNSFVILLVKIVQPLESDLSGELQRVLRTSRKLFQYLEAGRMGEAFSTSTRLLPATNGAQIRDPGEISV